MPIASAAGLGKPTWPDDRPFPLTAEECLALCRGDLVHTSLMTAEASATFPFRLEMIDGWIGLTRT